MIYGVTLAVLASMFDHPEHEGMTKPQKANVRVASRRLQSNDWVYEAPGVSQRQAQENSWPETCRQYDCEKDGECEWDWLYHRGESRSIQPRLTFRTKVPLERLAQQSPIDIDTKHVGTKGHEYLGIEHGHEHGPVVTNTGWTFLVEYYTGFAFFGHVRYKMLEYHFHFPSEHAFDGQLYAGELHVVHQKVASKNKEVKASRTDQCIYALADRAATSLAGSAATTVRESPVGRRRKSFN